MDPKRRKRIRLPSTVYATEGVTFSVTISTAPRMPIFEDLDLGLACVGMLDRLRSSTDARVHAYCLMPDHVHLLLSASDRISTTAIVQRWKSLCYREWLRRGRGPSSPWQRSFWDHGLRADEDLLFAARYILNNPVRAGLVADFHDYPLCGSMEWDL